MINFEKMHGNGNDFIVLNSLEKNFHPKKSFIKKLSNRNLGIGFDQLILVSPPTKYNSDFYIKFYNADGGQANMCLNGIRCAASYIWKNKFAPVGPLNFQTKKRLVICGPKKNNVEVLVGSPEHVVNESLTNAIKKIIPKDSFNLVDAGNLHLCIKKRSIRNDDLGGLYKKLEKCIKPFNINLSIYKSSSDFVDIRTYENGAGETLSCGSASISVAFLHLKDKLKQVGIKSFGGELKFKKNNNNILMTGPAAFVYSGSVNE